MLEFGAGVVAIVGPNGSGKSNLVDAVRWVLGEQNPRTLRAQRMEDLIFSGANGRRPVSICEVSLVLDNSERTLPLDFEEVAVTRRMSRDGISDYYINRTPCRLKDINDLLADTGIGRDAYSIIGQGKIDEVLSSRPEDRRGIFEEAAGIVRFRNRKREALKRLQETREGQIRLKDIITEVESQIEPLREQAAKAEEHRRLQQTLASLEIGRELHRAMSLETQLAEQRSNLEELSHKAERERERIRQIESELLSVTRQMEEQQQHEACLEQSLDEAESVLRRTEYERALAEERKSGVAESLEKARQSRQTAEVRVHSLQEAQSSQHDEILAIRSEVEVSRQCVKEAERRLASVQSEWDALGTELESLRHTLILHNRESDRLRSEAFSFTDRARAAQIEVGEYEHERLDAEQQLSQLRTRVETETRRAEDIRRELAESESMLEVLRAQTAKAREQRDSVEARLVEARSAHATLSGRATVLQEMSDRLEGYAEGPKQVMRATKAGRLHGILGAVAELIRVSPGFERAVEALMGGSLQFIVTKTADDAKRAIQYLRQAKAGRATFLPLDTIRTHSLSQREIDAMDEVPDIKPASTVVSCEEMYSPVVQHLLGRSLVCNNMDSALSYGRATRFTVKIATESGDMVNTGGSLTGGDRRTERPGLVQRRVELDTVLAEHKKVQAQITELETSLLAESAKFGEVEARRLEAESGIMRLESELKSTERAAREIAGFVQAGIRRVEELAHRSKERRALALGLARKAREYGILAEEALTECEEIGQKVHRLGERTSALESSRSDANAGFAKAREELARKEQLELAAEARLSETRRRVDEAHDLVKSLTEECDRLAGAFTELERRLEQFDEDVLSARQARDDAKQAYESVARERESNSRRHASLERANRTASRTLDGLTLTLVDATREESRLSTSVAALMESLETRFGITLERARSMYDLMDESVEPRIVELRDEISQMGNVNHSAPEELKRARERLEFLRRQDRDLDQASADLLGIIDDIDSKMRTIFKESFSRIRDEFKSVFRELFGGGDADLWLDDPSNILESGIEISARPPGRSTHSMSLLSGGERCLTAIALLFAVQNQRPSPFCVLDEIEASLDDANIERFCSFLQKVASDNQYILITHQKRTMEVSDVLYGLTMQESGVSRTLSVKVSGEY